MNKYFITLCDGPYEKNRELLNNIAHSSDYKTISLKPSDLPTEFTNQVSNIMKIKRGLGLCVWKPYIILQAFKNMNEGEHIIYVDSADILHPHIFSYVQQCLDARDILLVPSPSRNLQKHFTKRDCFVLMNCDEQKYWDSIQIEAGFIVAKKNELVIQILNEWLSFCINENIITDIPNICGIENFPNFVTHRHDQSIMSNLAIKYNIALDFNLLNFINHNVVQ